MPQFVAVVLYILIHKTKRKRKRKLRSKLLIQCTVSKKDPHYASSDLEIFPDEFSKYAKFLNNYGLTKLFKVFVRPGDEYLIKL